MCELFFFLYRKCPIALMALDNYVLVTAVLTIFASITKLLGNEQWRYVGSIKGVFEIKVISHSKVIY